jgi:hypothetical protein
MKEENSIFKHHYENYLRQLAAIDLSMRKSVLGIAVDKKRGTALIPFFKNLYRVSKSGVLDDRTGRPDYGTCVVLLKYLLMCPKSVPSTKDWANYRDFKDSGQAQNAGLSAHATMAISKCFAGDLIGLKAAADAMEGRLPEIDYAYDLSMVFEALPRVPLLFLFNDADGPFPAQALILFEQRAAHFLDAECRIMVEWYLFKYLKRFKHLLAGN